MAKRQYTAILNGIPTPVMVNEHFGRDWASREKPRDRSTNFVPKIKVVLTHEEDEQREC